MLNLLAVKTLVSFLSTLNRFPHFSGISIVAFEQVNAGRDQIFNAKS